MFKCTICRKTSAPGEKMMKVPNKAAMLKGKPGVDIVSELAVCPKCFKDYTTALAAVAPDVNPLSAYAALVK